MREVTSSTHNFTGHKYELDARTSDVTKSDVTIELPPLEVDPIPLCDVKDHDGEFEYTNARGTLYDTRNIELIDTTVSVALFMLCGRQAREFNEEHQGSVIAIKHARVQKHKGKIKVSGARRFEINPTDDAADKHLKAYMKDQQEESPGSVCDNRVLEKSEGFNVFPLCKATDHIGRIVDVLAVVDHVQNIHICELMGADFSKETLDTWNAEEVKQWTIRAKDLQKGYYNGYSGAQYHAIPRNELPIADRSLIEAKVCYALFGPPSNEKSSGWNDAYSREQKQDADKIVKILLDVAGVFDGNIHMLVIFVMCKMDDKEFPLPLFKIKNKKGDDNFVDTSQRTYDSWTDWESNNNLPMMKYCYPKFGFYSCASTNHYYYVEAQSPALTFGTSPACDFAARAGRIFDGVGSITALASGAVAVVGLFTPLAPVVIGITAVAGGSSAVYGTARSAYRLYDKGTHGESLTDLESGVAWLAIALTPVAFATSIVNSNLANGARTSGRIFSSSTRTAATLLNFTNIGLQGGMLLFGIANLVEKGADRVTKLDVLQLSMSVFFFGNTLVQPKTASQIISQAQDKHFTQYKDQMTDAATKRSFEKFLADNKGGGGIAAKSKIVRSINRINTPEQVFNGVNKFDKVEIGGRKGKTLLLSKGGHQPTRINPNRVFFDTRPTVGNAVVSTLLGANYDKFEVDGRRIFEGAPEYEVAGLYKAIKACGPRKGPHIYDGAKLLAKNFKARSPGDLQSIIEILNRELSGVPKSQFHERLSTLTHSQDFINGVNADVAKATAIGERNNLRFASPLKAAYHYRKHGAEFPTKLPHKLEFYLEAVPAKVLKSANLANVVNTGDAVIKTYSGTNGDFMVTTERAAGERIICTVFKNPRFAEKYAQRVAELVKSTRNIVGESWPDTFNRINENLGTNQLLYSIHTDGQHSSAYDADGQLSADASRSLAIALMAIEEVIN